MKCESFINVKSARGLKNTAILPKHLKWINNTSVERRKCTFDS